MSWAKAVESIKEAVNDFEENEVDGRFKELGKVSKELYRWLRFKTEGETQLVVLAEKRRRWDKALGAPTCKIQQTKTMSRLMRLQQESMYPRAVNTMELVGAIMAWEDKLKNDTRPARRNKDTRDVEDVCDVEALSKGGSKNGGAEVGREWRIIQSAEG